VGFWDLFEFIFWAEQPKTPTAPVLPLSREELPFGRNRGRSSGAGWWRERSRQRCPSPTSGFDAAALTPPVPDLVRGGCRFGKESREVVAAMA
jgi:hypothetical protein